MHGRPNAASKSGSQLNIIGAAFILCISARRGQPEMSKRQAFPGRRNGWFGDNGVPAKSSRIPDVAIFVPGWNLPPSMPSMDWSVQDNTVPRYKEKLVRAIVNWVNDACDVVAAGEALLGTVMRMSYDVMGCLDAPGPYWRYVYEDLVKSRRPRRARAELPTAAYTPSPTIHAHYASLKRIHVLEHVSRYAECYSLADIERSRRHR